MVNYEIMGNLVDVIRGDPRGNGLTGGLNRTGCNLPSLSDALYLIRCVDIAPRVVSGFFFAHVLGRHNALRNYSGRTKRAGDKVSLRVSGH
jgi:hypothetical protein